MILEPERITRENVATELVEKHTKALKVVKEEYERYQAQENELDAAAESYRAERDKLNIKVQTLKEDRQRNYSESKELRKEFMANLQKKKEMKDIPMEVLILTKQIDQLEWEIQTEAINVNDEKKLVKQIENNLDKLHRYAEMYKDHEEVSSAVRELTHKLNKKMKFAEEKHSKMLTAVDRSDEYHKKFVDAIMRLRDARAKRVGFQRDMEKHEKGIEHWNKIVEAEVHASKSKIAKKIQIKDDKESENKEPGQKARIPHQATENNPKQTKKITEEQFNNQKPETAGGGHGD